MNKSLFTNIVLVFVIVGLYWFISQPPSTVENNKLSSLAIEQATKIQIKRHDRDDILLNKIGRQWFISQPIQAPANATRIKLILDLLSSHSSSQLTLDSHLALKQFDLDPATISLLINQHRFDFGNIEPLSKQRYIVHNNIIHLVNDTVAPLLNANANSFINNRLFPEEVTISSLSLPEIINQQSASPALSIELEEGHWQSTQSHLSADQLASIISAWQHAYALQVFSLTAEQIQAEIGQTMSVSFTNQPSIKLLLQFNRLGMSLIDVDKKLRYQFPLSAITAFFPMQDNTN